MEKYSSVVSGAFSMKVLVNDGKEALSILDMGTETKTIMSKTNQEFWVEVSNNSPDCVMMRLCIDGKNVDGNVYTIVYPSVKCLWKGWRQNMNEVVVFKFDDPKKPTTPTGASTNDRDVGLISAQVYRATKISAVASKGDDSIVSTTISTEVNLEHKKKQSTIVGGDKTVNQKTSWSKENYNAEELIALLEVRYNYIKFQPPTVDNVAQDSSDDEGFSNDSSDG